MKISIVVPVFNEEKTIIQILEKVNAQNNKPFPLEVIVIDDCSTDNSNIILKENSELYKKLIVLEKNSGKGAAVREGLLEASGDYILFQDADLEYDPDDYEKIFKIIEMFEPDVVMGSRFLSPKFTRVHYFFHKVGNIFDVYVTDELTSVSAHVNDVSVPGANMFIEIYEVDTTGGNLNFIFLEVSNDYEIQTSDIDNWVNINFDPPINMMQGQYLVVAGGYATG